jgi:hypothetical protein
MEKACKLVLTAIIALFLMQGTSVSAQMAERAEEVPGKEVVEEVYASTTRVLHISAFKRSSHTIYKPFQSTLSASNSVDIISKAPIFILIKVLRH